MSKKAASAAALLVALPLAACGSAESGDDAHLTVAVMPIVDTAPIHLALWRAFAAVAGGFYLPTPDVIAETFWRMWSGEHLVQHALPSVGRALAGLGIAILLGVALGVPIGLSPRLAALTAPLLAYFRAMPPVVALPAASPQILTGVRIASALALILMVVSEMFAASEGLGFLIVHAQRTFAVAEMWSGIVLLSLIGIAFAGAMAVLERGALRWHAEERA